MADWEKKGVKGNVDAGPGSKGKKSADGGSGAGKAHGPDVTAHSGGSPAFSSGKKTSADATEQTHNVEYAEGGDKHMFGEQVAGPRTGSDKSASSGKPDSSGPGEKFAKGGSGKMFGYTGALPATAGISAARES